MIGKTLGHYQITEKLGEGGMGAVYKARGLYLNRCAALPIIPQEKSPWAPFEVRPLEARSI